MPEPMDHAEHRGVIETILRYIPGFRGYLEKEYRREADELQREWLAGRLQQAKKAIDAAARPLVDAGQLDLLPQFDRVRSRLDKVLWQIRSAMQGYSGFFDMVQIGQDDLDRIYAHDVGLIDDVQQLTERIEVMPAQPDKLADALPEVLNLIDDLEDQLNLRADILKGLE